MDRGLLVALLALQNQSIIPSQFLRGFQTWLDHRNQGLDAILVEQASLTKNQCESLTLALTSLLEKSPGDWQTAVAENNAIGLVYKDMLALAENDATVLEWIKMLETSISNLACPVDTGGPLGTEKDPFGTIDFDSELGPYATLSNEEDEAQA